MFLIRRSLLAMAAALALGGPSAAADLVGETAMTLGSPDAKVKMVEYASVTCPHCAQFHNEVLPAFKAKYIDTGLVQLTFREFPTQPANIAVAGFMLARCGGPARYFQVLDTLFKGQAELYESREASKFLGDAAIAAGLDQESMQACLTDRASIDAMGQRFISTADADMIEGTPTFIIGGTRVVGSRTLAEFDAVIEPLLK